MPELLSGSLAGVTVSQKSSLLYQCREGGSLLKSTQFQELLGLYCLLVKLRASLQGRSFPSLYNILNYSELSSKTEFSSPRRLLHNN